MLQFNVLLFLIFLVVLLIEIILYYFMIYKKTKRILEDQKLLNQTYVSKIYSQFFEAEKHEKNPDGSHSDS